MANNLGHEVDLDRNEYKYLASEDTVSSAAKSGTSAQSGACLLYTSPSPRDRG